MVARLVAEAGPLTGRVITLEEAAEWVLGRDPDLCNLSLEDATASREHLRIRPTTGGYLVENLSTTNPALLNGEPLTAPHLLQEGDQLQVGTSLLQYTTSEVASPAPAPEEEEETYETLFEEGAGELPPETEISEEGLGRWLIKVISGPNSGAELSLEPGRSYLIGTDAGSCDILLYDLSVSRQHARLTVSDDDQLAIEDLHSRNGVVINGEKALGKQELSGNAMVALGTTHFIAIDREGEQETVVSAMRMPPTPQAPPAEEIAETPGAAAAMALTPPMISSEEVVGQRKGRPVLSGGMVLALVIALSLLAVVVTATFSLFRSETVEVPKTNYDKQIQTATEEFPSVRASFTPATGNLLLVGHVLTPVDMSELLYNLQAIDFIRHVDDNVVVDQYVWQETNQILGKNPEWNGVSMHASAPGQFVIVGYLQTRSQAASLQDYLLLSFPYVDQLKNEVVVEEILLDDIQAQLQNAGLMSVIPQLSNGELTLTGYINSAQVKTLQKVIGQLQQTPGIRVIRNFVVEVAPQEAVVDLSGKYQVHGYSTHDKTIVNVLINGRILSRGDQLDGMTIVGIQSGAIYLEKDGVKYKINYNQ